MKLAEYFDCVNRHMPLILIVIGLCLIKEYGQGKCEGYEASNVAIFRSAIQFYPCIQYETRDLRCAQYSIGLTAKYRDTETYHNEITNSYP